MKFDIYIFDLDGTLLNLGNIGVYADQILQKTLSRLNAPVIPGENERRQFWGSGNNYIDILNKWGVSKAQDFWEHYDKVDFKQRKILFKQKKIALFDGVEEVLEKLYTHNDGKNIAIVTNTSDYVVEFFLKKFNIASFFQEVFSMGLKNDQQFAKPSPRGILSILEKFQYDQDIHRALMIGDSYSDIKAAKKANISACLVKRNIMRHDPGTIKRDFQPDYIIERLDEILEL